MPSASLSISAGLFLLCVWLFSKFFLNASRGVTTTRLRGPPRTNLILGLSEFTLQSVSMSGAYEEWATRYGAVYAVPTALGRQKIIVTDSTALLHVYNAERTVYEKPKSDRKFLGEMFGHGIAWAEGDEHKRQRKALSPAFSNAAIRKLTPVFQDSTHKVKSTWDDLIESPEGAIIDVQKWLNAIGLDSIGIAGFAHDFHVLDGERSPVTAVFEALEHANINSFDTVVLILSFVFPIMSSLPTRRTRLFWELRRTLEEIAGRMLEDTRREKEVGVVDGMRDKSLIGLLLKAGLKDSEMRMTPEEVASQMNVLLLAGYETSSASLTWTLMELAWHPEIQEKLRKELSQGGDCDDATWDQLTYELPYLDAVVLEALRVHPVVTELGREAIRDDIIPLGTPIVTASGETVSNITIAKGSTVVTPIRCINRSEAFWGPDAKIFRPERWLEPITGQAKDLQGHRHLLTFHDGCRACIGKGFALAEMKAVLSILVRHFTFEFPDGLDTKVETHVTIVVRPKVAGQDGTKVPLRVKRVE
ncbi:cytochrome P450 [Mycena alexandri]|uniref:Cytochrome P450 n=1 Tax=Mycena alexandri TaxID=1745969 RepID=A0AAD6STG4_9AGAR|nr:cytochrome P450 [Mycena alexandri]